MDTPLTVTDKLASALDAGWDDESAATAIEYGLMASLVVVGCIAAFTNYSSALTLLYNNWITPAVAAL